MAVTSMNADTIRNMSPKMYRMMDEAGVLFFMMLSSNMI